jgi:hypothetical protein
MREIFCYPERNNLLITPHRQRQALWSAGAQAKDFFICCKVFTFTISPFLRRSGDWIAVALEPTSVIPEAPAPLAQATRHLR